MGIRLLGVEAGPSLEQLLRPLVEAESYQLVTAPSLAAAQVILTDAEPIHVALIDETLPDGPGIGLLAGLQRAHPNAEAILLAAQPPAAETIVAGLRAGAYDCLEKSPGVLARVVTAIERIQLRLAQQHKPADASANASRLALAMSAADESVWDWHIGSNRLAVSALWWHQLGEGAQDSSTIEAWLARVHPDDAASLRRALDAAAAGENARVDCEYRVRHRDGGYRWLRSSRPRPARRLRNRVPRGRLAVRRDAAQADGGAAPARRPVRSPDRPGQPGAVP